MKIKIINLLNLVYEKKMPKRIMYKGFKCEFNQDDNDYKADDKSYLFEYLFECNSNAL